jgi:sec-independent protein translocase protein TatC
MIGAGAGGQGRPGGASEVAEGAETCFRIRARMPPRSEDPQEPARPLGNDPERTMGFLDHLEELRWTLVKSFSVFGIALVGISFFMRDFARVLNWPFHRGMEEFPEAGKLVTTTPMGIFSVVMLVCFLGALVVSLPFILYFAGQFVAPALTKKERGLLLPACVAAAVLFVAGALFSYFVLAPSVIWMSAYLNVLFGLEGFWSADRYYSMLVWLVLGMGAAFQFPMVIQIMVYIGLVTVPRLRALRRIMVLVCCVAGALITPTGDPINMGIVAVPLYVLYELAIFVAAVFTARKAAEARGESREE